MLYQVRFGPEGGRPRQDRSLSRQVEHPRPWVLRFPRSAERLRCGSPVAGPALPEIPRARSRGMRNLALWNGTVDRRDRARRYQSAVRRRKHGMGLSSWGASGGALAGLMGGWIQRRWEVNFLRSFVKCHLCRLRMQGHERRGVRYYTCQRSRRKTALVPEGHPPTGYVNEKWASERVLRFLDRHIFGERLWVAVTLTGTLVLPGEDGVSQDLSVPPVGTEQNLRKSSQVWSVPPGGIQQNPRTLLPAQARLAAWYD